MFFLRMLLLPLMAFLAQGCASVGGAPWKAMVQQRTSELGFRNWIVIAEASFPAYSRAGVHQVSADVEVSEALSYVLEAIDQTQHVRPHVFLTREMRSMSNDVAPGIDEMRAKTQQSLAGLEFASLDQESLMSLLADANRSFDVLLIRTNTALPYSSVFIELQPGYWDAESEQQLRDRIQRERKKIPPP